jgi:hypothetical protein
MYSQIDNFVPKIVNLLFWPKYKELQSQGKKFFEQFILSPDQPLVGARRGARGEGGDGYSSQLFIVIRLAPELRNRSLDKKRPKGDSPIFVDTKIGTVPSPSGRGKTGAKISLNGSKIVLNGNKNNGKRE